MCPFISKEFGKMGAPGLICYIYILKNIHKFIFINTELYIISHGLVSLQH
jgi:hypothetical protein